MTATLLMIDWQSGLDHPTHWSAEGVSPARSTPNAEINALRLLAHWRACGQTVRHVFHDSTSPDSPLHPSQSGNAHKPGFAPMFGEIAYRKSVNSAFVGTDLEADLRAAATSHLVICGLTTHHCVSTTTRWAGNLGFEVTLVGDASAAHARAGHDGMIWDAETVHAVTLASLHAEFCTVMMTDDVLNA